MNGDRADSIVDSKKLEKLFDEAGFELVAWGDGGLNRLFSTKPFARPADLKRARPWAWKDDPVYLGFISAIGANPVKVGAMEVYGGLPTSLTAFVPASAQEADPCADGIADISGTLQVCTMIRESSVNRILTQSLQAVAYIQDPFTGPTAHVSDTLDGPAFSFPLNPARPWPGVRQLVRRREPRQLARPL